MKRRKISLNFFLLIKKKEEKKSFFTILLAFVFMVHLY